MTEQISENWNKIKEKSKKLRALKTNRKLIKKLPGGRDRFGNELEFDYIELGEFYKWLDEYYPGWSWQVDSSSAKEFAGSFNVVGTLTVFEESGIPRIFTCVGSKRIKVKKESKDIVELDYYKAAESDALKRAVSRLGGFNDIYTKSEFESYDEDKVTWFFDKIYPKLIYKIIHNDNYDYEKLKILIIGFIKGKISREDIENKYLIIKEEGK